MFELLSADNSESTTQLLWCKITEFLYGDWCGEKCDTVKRHKQF